MKSEEWTQIDELFGQALNLAPGDRQAFLDQACAGKDFLRRQVESLLANDSQAGSFLEQPPGEIAAELLSSGTPRFEKGQHIGHYTVIGCVGAGAWETDVLGRPVGPPAGGFVPARQCHCTAGLTRDSERKQECVQEYRSQ